MKLNCLIIDDEPVARGILERYIEQLEWLELAACCKNALEANEWLGKEQVDLIFLDIEMPHLNGLDFLGTLVNPPKVILTTAYREYALEGYELNVVDYLLKPISFERFLKAVNKAGPREVARSEPETPSAQEDYLYIKADKKMVQLYFKDILYIEGLSNYVRIFTKHKPIISYQKLSYLESVLPAADFFRCHRSYIVSVSNIRAYNATHLEIGDTEIPIGGSYRESTQERLRPFEA
jgi:DNA-binding LytR/AlgR family response regulator